MSSKLNTFIVTTKVFNYNQLIPSVEKKEYNGRLLTHTSIVLPSLFTCTMSSDLVTIRHTPRTTRLVTFGSKQTLHTTIAISIVWSASFGTVNTAWF